MGPLNRALREWEAHYSTERLHQSLGSRLREAPPLPRDIRPLRVRAAAFYAARQGAILRYVA